MKKWLMLVPVAVVILWVFLKEEELTPSRTTSTAPSFEVSQAPFAGAPPLDPPPRLPSSRAVKPLRERLDPQVPLKVGSKRYVLHETLVAISRLRALELKLEHQSLGAWALVDVSEAPLEGLPVVKREGSEVLGVFRGVLKTLSQDVLVDGGAWSECPATILSASPEIKVYLFEISGEASPEELRQCLEETRLFNRLEWEVLDQPRLNR